MKRSLLACLIIILASVMAIGQVKVIDGATVIDGTGRAPLKNATIIIDGTRIRRIGTKGELKIPEGAEVIDAREKFVIPGLADMHNHLDSDSIGITQDTQDFKSSLQRMLGWGFTIIFDPASRALSGLPELKRISSPDTAPYPHYYAIGRTFGAKNGHGPQTKYTPETIAEARAAVREVKSAGTDAVKIYYTDLIYVTTNLRPMLKPDVMAAIIDEAHKQGLKVYVHAPVLKYAKEVLRAGADGLAHGILSDPVDDEFISLMKKNDAVYVATNAVFNSVADLTGWSKRAQTADSNGIISQAIFDAGTSPELEKQWNSRWNNIAYTKERIPTLQANLRKVYAAGIPVVLGSDSSGAFVGLASQIELSLEAEAGLSAYQVIQTATINAARMINREKDLGSIEEGKLADMLILNADPLADIANIRKIYRIVKGGVVYEQSQLLPKQN
jgi:imidazolonepropionase-like amidohydrolase